LSDYSVRIKKLGKRFVRSDGTQSLVRQLFGKNNSHDHFWALKDVDIDIRKGESFGLVGPNGAGKSTLLKIISRILMPTEGEIELYGQVNSLLEVGTGFEPDLTGRANVYLNGAILGMSRKEVDAIYEEIVEFSGLRDFMDMPVKHYSSGMYARLAFSVAAYVTGDILAVDEVLSVGDAEFRRKSMKRMEDLLTTGGRTIIFVSHNSDAITRFCDKAAWLDRGRIQEIGTADDVVRAYLGGAAKRQAFFVVDRKSDNEGGRNKQKDDGTVESGLDVKPTGADTETDPTVTYLVRRGEFDRSASAARIEKVALVDENGVPRDVVFRDELQVFEFEFTVEKETGPFSCYFTVSCGIRKGVRQETNAFSDFSKSASYPPGRYSARVTVPPNVLTSADYHVLISLRTIGKPAIVHDTLKRVVEFRVVDRDPKYDVGAELMRGVVRLDLPWEIEPVSAERETGSVERSSG
jgi:ABC-type polysaccharide/polyol phosphate transport system ATPase subunit